MSALKKISGYKGVGTRIAAGELEFFIVAENIGELEQLYYSILEDADLFTPETCSAVIVISADDLRKLKSGKFTTATHSEDEPPRHQEHQG